jgi:uncharacterized repeat protein (TIGR01451 family)
MSPKWFCSTAALVAVILVPGVARAQTGAAPIALAMTAENLQGADQRHLDLAAQRGGQVPMMPGDTLRYRLTFTNVRHDSVHNVQFNDPLPNGLLYVPGSAHADRADIDVAFSIDGGKTYSPQPMVDELIDGRTVRKPAPASRYTHVRWTLRGWVQPLAQVTAEFNAHLTSDGGVKP